MSKLSCAGCRLHLADFYGRKLPRSLNRRVVGHLRHCDACLEFAEKNRYGKANREDTIPAFHAPRDGVPPKGQALAKWGAFLLLVVCAVSLACFACDAAFRTETESHIRAWIALRYPLGEVGTTEIDWTRWLPIYRHETYYPLFERDGVGSGRRLGTVIVSQRLWQREVDVRLDEQDRLVFHLPTKEEKSDGVAAPETWTMLEQLPASVTVRLAFSTRHVVTPQAMEDMLKRYDVQLLSMPVYGGETVAQLRKNPPAGLTLWKPSSGPIDLQKSMRTFRENLNTVAENTVRKEEQKMWEWRRNYVNKNGIRTYGAIVEGSPQALLQLQEVLELQSPTIVRIDWTFALHSIRQQRCNDTALFYDNTQPGSVPS